MIHLKDSYSGNFGLCGRPLSKKCTRETEQEKIEDDEDDDFFFSGFTWGAVAIGYGCGVLVGFIVRYIMFMGRKTKMVHRNHCPRIGPQGKKAGD